MQFRELKKEEELENYRHAIASHIDVLLPLEYLKQGKVFGMFNKNNHLCGGFALILHGPFRVLESIPNFKGPLFDPHLKHTCEITGVWLSQKNRTKYSSVKFWTKLIAKILATRKKYFVYAYSTRKTGLCKIYAKANPMILFQGETKILPGMPSADHETIEVVFRNRIFIQILKNPEFFLKRILPKTKNKKNINTLIKKNDEVSHELKERFITKDDFYSSHNIHSIHNASKSSSQRSESQINY